MKHYSLLLFLPLVLLACTKKNDQAGRPANVIASVNHTKAPPKVATPEEWKSALMSTYEEKQVEEKGDGITKFMAKFNIPNGGPNSLAFGERDAFRKLRFYSMGLPMQISTGVKAYISVKDNQRPVLFLQPYYWGHNWIFMQKIAVLVDGEIALEHECGNPDRDVHGVGVEEKCDFILSSSEIDALRKITSSSKVSVRLTGTKGYVNVGRDGYNPLKDFIRDIQSGIAIYDLIDSAVKNKLPLATSA
jgi:hypothetical protein